jgi:hypothetical protein
MKNAIIYTFITIITLVVIFLLTQMGNMLGLWNIKFWGTKYEDARRDVFENTKSFRDGSNRDLMELCIQYKTAQDESAKMIIASTINQRRLSVPDDALTSNTLNCLYEVK